MYTFLCEVKLNKYNLISEVIEIISDILVAQGICEVICICFFVRLTENDKILLHTHDVCEVMHSCLLAKRNKINKIIFLR